MEPTASSPCPSRPQPLCDSTSSSRPSPPRLSRTVPATPNNLPLNLYQQPGKLTGFTTSYDTFPEFHSSAASSSFNQQPTSTTASGSSLLPFPSIPASSSPLLNLDFSECGSGGWDWDSSYPLPNFDFINWSPQDIIDDRSTASLVGGGSSGGPPRSPLPLFASKARGGAEEKEKGVVGCGNGVLAGFEVGESSRDGHGFGFGRANTRAMEFGVDGMVDYPTLVVESPKEGRVDGFEEPSLLEPLFSSGITDEGNLEKKIMEDILFQMSPTEAAAHIRTSTHPLFLTSAAAASSEQASVEAFTFPSNHHEFYPHSSLPQNGPGYSPYAASFDASLSCPDNLAPYSNSTLHNTPLEYRTGVDGDLDSIFASAQESYLRGHRSKESTDSMESIFTSFQSDSSPKTSSPTSGWLSTAPPLFNHGAIDDRTWKGINPVTGYDYSQNFPTTGQRGNELWFSNHLNGGSQDVFAPLSTPEFGNQSTGFAPEVFQNTSQHQPPSHPPLSPFVPRISPSLDARISSRISQPPNLRPDLHGSITKNKSKPKRAKSSRLKKHTSLPSLPSSATDQFPPPLPLPKVRSNTIPLQQRGLDDFSFDPKWNRERKGKGSDGPHRGALEPNQFYLLSRERHLESSKEQAIKRAVPESYSSRKDKSAAYSPTNSSPMLPQRPMGKTDPDGKHLKKIPIHSFQPLKQFKKPIIVVGQKEVIDLTGDDTSSKKTHKPDIPVVPLNRGHKVNKDDIPILPSDTPLTPIQPLPSPTCPLSSLHPDRIIHFPRSSGETISAPVQPTSLTPLHSRPRSRTQSQPRLRSHSRSRSRSRKLSSTSVHNEFNPVVKPGNGPPVPPLPIVTSDPFSSAMASSCSNSQYEYSPYQTREPDCIDQRCPRKKRSTPAGGGTTAL